MRGRRVVITAGANGIGLAIARAFVEAGDRVHICDVDESGLATAVETIPGLTGTVCDVADREAVRHFVADAALALGGIDVLINNAGIAGETAPVAATSPESWDAVLAVDLTGAFDVTRHAIPHLTQSESGVILMMSSLAGRFGYPERSAYAVAKRGLLALVETLALELGAARIRVNAIAPGGVEGDRVRRVLAARAEASGRSVEEETSLAMANQALPYFVDPEDIAQLCVFLASDAAKSITGQTIAIDGGAKGA